MPRRSFAPATYNADVARRSIHQVAGRLWRTPRDRKAIFPTWRPRVVDPNGGVAAWADAGTICPLTIYQVYNDRRLLAKHYAAMGRWVEYCRKNSKDLLRPAAGFGDWLSIKADTPLDVIATAYFAYSTHLTAEAARAIRQTRRRPQVRRVVRRKSRTAFNKAYVAPDTDALRATRRPATSWPCGVDLCCPKEKRATRRLRYLVDDVQVARHASIDRLRGHECADADAFGQRQHAAGVQAAVERHLPLVGASRSNTARRAFGSGGTAGRLRRDSKMPA